MAETNAAALICDPPFQSLIPDCPVTLILSLDFAAASTLERGMDCVPGLAFEPVSDSDIANFMHTSGTLFLSLNNSDFLAD